MQPLKRLVLCLFLIHSFFLSAQNELCGTNMPEGNIFDEPFNLADQHVTMGSFLNEQPFVLKVHFWDFAEDNGNNIEIVTEEERLNLIAEFNKEFNNYNIFFKYDGHSVINSTDWSIFNYEIEESDFYNAMRDMGYYHPGTMNIYSPDHVDEVGAFAFFDDEQTKIAGIVKDIDLATGYNFRPFWIHEIGHFLGLEHTFKSCLNNGCIENVAREGEPNFNADWAGDEIIDTFATPEGMEGGVGYDINSCLYTDMTATDAVGRLYSDYEPEVTNYMSYSSECRARFSPGQIAVMRAWIDFFEHQPDGITFITTYDISILYEPYAGFYAPYFPYVGNEPPLFQPGFTYRFVECECECPQPTDFYNTNFTYSNTSLLTIAADETDYSLIAHPNHSAITIAEVPEIFGNPQEERRCWDNWVTPPVIGGTVTLFNDGVFNTNVTITPQDSTQINNPNLINDLDNGLYNIKKHIIDGTVDETNILKENE